MTPLDPKSRVAPKKIVLATAFSPASEAALPYALTIARHYGSQLFVAHVIPPEFRDVMAPDSAPAVHKEARQSAQQNMEHILSAGRQQSVSCQALIGEGAIWDVLHGMTIIKFASEHGVDLIVMGVRNYDPAMAAHLPKPDTAYEVVRTAPCPVLTVR